jgi:[ribosomal protein S5]-alanine N-acetyltransferase
MLKTKKYLLRVFNQNDLHSVFEGLSHPDVIRYYGVSYHTLASTQIQIDWFNTIEKENTGRWRAICSLDNKHFYGAIGFNNWSSTHQKAEIGFWLLPNAWGKGIIKEVMPVMLDYAFNEMNLHRIEAEVETLNQASKSILLKHGFKLEGTKVDCEVKNGKLISLDIFVKIKH